MDNLTMARRRYQQLLHGICSVRDCDEPIVGWCATCDDKGHYLAPKLCVRHLAIHVVAKKHTEHIIERPWEDGDDAM